MITSLRISFCKFSYPLKLLQYFEVELIDLPTRLRQTTAYKATKLTIRQKRLLLCLESRPACLWRNKDTWALMVRLQTCDPGIPKWTRSLQPARLQVTYLCTPSLGPGPCRYTCSGIIIFFIQQSCGSVNEVFHVRTAVQIPESCNCEWELALIHVWIKFKLVTIQVTKMRKIAPGDTRSPLVNIFRDSPKNYFVFNILPEPGCKETRPLGFQSYFCRSAKYAANRLC